MSYTKKMRKTINFMKRAKIKNYWSLQTKNIKNVSVYDDCG